jgi:hypothetical protein
MAADHPMDPDQIIIHLQQVDIRTLAEDQLASHVIGLSHQFGKTLQPWAHGLQHHQPPEYQQLSAGVLSLINRPNDPGTKSTDGRKRDRELPSDPAE